MCCRSKGGKNESPPLFSSRNYHILVFPSSSLPLVLCNRDAIALNLQFILAGDLPISFFNDYWTPTSSKLLARHFEPVTEGNPSLCPTQMNNRKCVQSYPEQPEHYSLHCFKQVCLISGTLHSTDMKKLLQNMANLRLCESKAELLDVIMKLISCSSIWDFANLFLTEGRAIIGFCSCSEDILHNHLNRSSILESITHSADMGLLICTQSTLIMSMIRPQINTDMLMLIMMFVCDSIEMNCCFKLFNDRTLRKH